MTADTVLNFLAQTPLIRRIIVDILRKWKDYLAWHFK